MRILFSTLLVVLLFFTPCTAQAADFIVNFSIFRVDDATCVELWYNDSVLWRVKFMAEDADAVAARRNSDSLVITPEIKDGMFTFKLRGK